MPSTAAEEATCMAFEHRCRQLSRCLDQSRVSAAQRSPPASVPFMCVFFLLVVILPRLSRIGCPAERTSLPDLSLLLSFSSCWMALMILGTVQLRLHRTASLSAASSPCVVLARDCDKPASPGRALWNLASQDPPECSRVPGLRHTTSNVTSSPDENHHMSVLLY